MIFVTFFVCIAGHTKICCSTFNKTAQLDAWKLFQKENLSEFVAVKTVDSIAHDLYTRHVALGRFELLDEKNFTLKLAKVCSDIIHDFLNKIPDIHQWPLPKKQREATVIAQIIRKDLEKTWLYTHHTDIKSALWPIFRSSYSRDWYYDPPQPHNLSKFTNSDHPHLFRYAKLKELRPNLTENQLREDLRVFFRAAIELGWSKINSAPKSWASFSVIMKQVKI